MIGDDHLTTAIGKTIFKAPYNIQMIKLPIAFEKIPFEKLPKAYLAFEKIPFFKSGL